MTAPTAAQALAFVFSLTAIYFGSSIIDFRARRKQVPVPVESDSDPVPTPGSQA